MTPLLSVAIPTHNRAKYAIHSILSLLSIQHDGLEIVVSDTSTDGELAAFMQRDDLPCLQDPRLRYSRPSERLDMTGNHNAALSETRGEYVCLIGDDDTITKDALEAAAWALEHGIELIAPNVVANYAWPDFRSRHFGAKHSARLYIAKDMGSASIHECAQALANALRNAAQGTDGLPKIYHGIVKKSLLESLRHRSGSYFHGSSPDVSGAIGLALIAQNFVVTDYPLTIPGASGGSNTGRSAMNKHKGKLGQESQTKAFQDTGWSPGVPRFFSVETVWAHAALETIHHLAPGRVVDFNFARLIAICTVLHPEYREDVDRATAEACRIMNLKNLKFEQQVKVEAGRFRRARWLHVAKRILNPTAAGGRYYVAGLETIAETPSALAIHMGRLQLSWGQVISQLNTIGKEDQR